MTTIVQKPEIDYRTMKFIVGTIAITLAFITNYLAGGDLPSISESYHEGGWPRDIFVGSMFVLAAFLVAYNGRSKWEYWLSKTSAVAAIGIAMFPCDCEGHDQIITGVHAGSAAVMFLMLAGFCVVFFRRAMAKETQQAKARAFIYAACFLVIVSVILVLAIDGLFDVEITRDITRLTFYAERAGLIAFGISWLTASHVLPLINNADERYSLL